MKGGAEDEQQATTQPAVTQPAVTQPDKPPPVEVTPDVTPDKPPVEVTPTQPVVPVAPEAPKEVKVDVDSTPEATVTVDGKKLGKTPLVVSVTEGKRVRLKLTADGYRTGELTLDGSETQVRMKLEKRKTVTKPDGDKRPERIGPLPIGN
jgi:hypothetical protein